MASVNGQKVNNAKIPLLQPYIQAGFNPKTGLPVKLENSLKSELKNAVKKIIRVNDEQVALNKYVWNNLPLGLDSQLMERVLYYRGQGAFFYMEELKKFFFLPYALDGTIDVYGRYTGITPLPFNGSQGKDEKEIKPWIKGLKFKPEYDIVMPEDLTLEHLESSCVLITDYCKQISQTVIPRQQLNDPICDLEADLFPYMRTNLLNGTGVSGMRVNDEDQQANVELASEAVDNAALNGKKWVGVVGNLEFQDLTGGDLKSAQEYLMCMQSIDNFRLGTHGIDNGGLFEKQGTVLQDELTINSGSTGIVQNDGLYQRQHACDIINSIWGLGVYVTIGECASGMDQNGDGLISDEQDQSGSPDSGDMPEEGGEE